ncbi:MAG: hypothetical protein GC185_12190 [Alphaproteobacteria bacterium]|nr:hypothetical protein [Alphaproteobacteria bacterium]
MENDTGKHTSSRLRKIFNAALLSVTVGGYAIGLPLAVGSMFSATSQDHASAMTCNEQTWNGQPCTQEQVQSLVAVNENYFLAYTGSTFLVFGSLPLAYKWHELSLREREEETKRKFQPSSSRPRGPAA